MANRAARRREERAGRAQKSPVVKGPASAPVINVWKKDNLFVIQVSLGPGYVAEMRMPLELAENFVKECEGVLVEMRTGIVVGGRSSGLITP